MKRIILFIAVLMGLTASAQPPKRQAEAAAQQQQRTQNAPRGVSYRDFPVAAEMPTDVSWRRDIYRRLNLKQDRNASLYYPITPQEGRVNLFTYLMKLILRQQVTAYAYNVATGNEDFNRSNAISAKKIMDDHSIYYTVTDGRMRVDDADLSLTDVTRYYIKESVYYDQHTATFHTQVTALCPVLVRGDADFGGEETEYPLFWVKYSDAAPYLGKLMLMESSLNNASTISADDYFTMNRYAGDIYKVVNLQDRLLAETARTDTALKAAQNKIEQELTAFHNHVWAGDSVKQDTAQTDSLAIEATKPTSGRRGLLSRSSSGTSRRSSNVSRRTPRRTAGPSTGNATFSVRRERH